MSIELQQSSDSIDLVINNIILKHPVQLSFLDCGHYLNYQAGACYVARVRKTFPVRVRQQGGKLVCHTIDLIDYIKTGKSQAEFSCTPIRKKAVKRVGRPTKVEQVQARDAGISVSQLRNRG